VEIDTTADYSEDTPQAAAPTGAIAVPQSDAALFIPKVGDAILCDDGTTYEIKDMTLHKNVGALPTATCDYAKFPALTCPPNGTWPGASQSRQHGLSLYPQSLCNSTDAVPLYIAIGANEQTGQDGRRCGAMEPLVARVQLFISVDTCGILLAVAVRPNHTEF
jgi:hypothetical protein